MENLLFYYSGTGNSLYDAVLIGKSLKNAKLISMKHRVNTGYTASGCKSAGFIFPVHYLKIPALVQDYIRNIKLENIAYTYAVVNYKGDEMNCLYDLEQLLQESGLGLDYAVFHKNVNADITSAFQSAYNIEQNVRAENSLQKIIDDILNRKKRAVRKNPLKSIVNQWANHYETVHQISCKYYSVNDSCDKCGRCQMVCSCENIKLENGAVKFLQECNHCFSCIQYCPQSAINITGITEAHEKYHHPFISFHRMAMPYLTIENGNVLEPDDKNSSIAVDRWKNAMIQ